MFEPSLCKRSRRNYVEIAGASGYNGLNQAFVNEVVETHERGSNKNDWGLNQAFVNEVAETISLQDLF